MKFGKRLEKQMYAKWADAYVNYKQLKKMMKRNPQNFVSELMSQLVTVNKFYEMNANYFTATLRELTMSVQQGVALDRVAFAEFWKELNHFRTYVMLNYMAVIKIVKKWNKKGGDRHAPLDAFAILHEQPFYHSRCFAHLLVRAEMLALSCVSPASVEKSDWTCPICLDILCNPVILDCAHRFCWSCITKVLEKTTCCPVCRKRLVIEDGDVRVDGTLEKFLHEQLSLNASTSTPSCDSVDPQTPEADRWACVPSTGKFKSMIPSSSSSSAAAASSGQPSKGSKSSSKHDNDESSDDDDEDGEDENADDDDLGDPTKSPPIVFSKAPIASGALTPTSTSTTTLTISSSPSKSSSPLSIPRSIGPPRKRAVVIGIHGLPTNALLLAPAVHLRRFLLGSRHTMAKAGTPGFLSVWASVLTGMREKRHGVIDIISPLDDETGPPNTELKCGTFLRTLRDKGYRTAVVAASSAIKALVGSDANFRLDDMVRLPEGAEEAVPIEFTRLLESEEDSCPDATFVYLNVLNMSRTSAIGSASSSSSSVEPEAVPSRCVGSASSFTSKRYLQAVKQTDEHVAVILSNVAVRKQEDWLIMVVSSLGTTAPIQNPEQWSSLTVLGAYCPGIEPNSELFPAPRNIDVAATVLQFFGLHKEAARLDGHPIGLSAVASAHPVVALTPTT